MGFFLSVFFVVVLCLLRWAVSFLVQRLSPISILKKKPDVQQLEDKNRKLATLKEDQAITNFDEQKLAACSWCKRRLGMLRDTEGKAFCDNCFGVPDIRCALQDKIALQVPEQAIKLTNMVFVFVCFVN